MCYPLQELRPYFSPSSASLDVPCARVTTCPRRTCARRCGAWRWRRCRAPRSSRRWTRASRRSHGARVPAGRASLQVERRNRVRNVQYKHLQPSRREMSGDQQQQQQQQHDSLKLPGAPTTKHVSRRENSEVQLLLLHDSLKHARTTHLCTTLPTLSRAQAAPAAYRSRSSRTRCSRSGRCSWPSPRARRGRSAAERRGP